MFSGKILISSKILENTHVVYFEKGLEVTRYLTVVVSIKFTRNVGTFRVDLKFVLDCCKSCVGLCRTDDGRPEKSVTVDEVKLDVVKSFHYLSYKTCLRCGCEVAKIIITTVRYGQ